MLDVSLSGIPFPLLTSNGHFNIHTRFDLDGSDLLHCFHGAVQVDDTLMNAHLEAIPGLATLTTRCFTGGDAEDLGGDTDGSS